jgi:hypothetical protein
LAIFSSAEFRGHVDKTMLAIQDFTFSGGNSSLSRTKEAGWNIGDLCDKRFLLLFIGSQQCVAHSQFQNLILHQ